MTTLADVRRLDSVQNQIIGSATSGLGGIFRRLDLSRPEQARDSLLDVYPALIDRHGDASATAAAEWYEVQRSNQRGGTYSAALAAGVALERSQGTVRWAADALFGDNPAGMLDLLEGSMIRSLGDMSRDTIVENFRQDRQAVGWQRLVHPDSDCDFCIMLSQRGAVYKRGTATFASHDNCRCRAAPTWDPSAPEVDVEAYEASERMESVRRRAGDPNLSASDRAQAQRILDRHRENIRTWIGDAKYRYPGMFD